MGVCECVYVMQTGGGSLRFEGAFAHKGVKAQVGEEEEVAGLGVGACAFVDGDLCFGFYVCVCVCVCVCVDKWGDEGVTGGR